MCIFRNCEVSLDNPSKQGILTAIQECKRNAEAMMGQSGSEIITHNYEEMMKLVNKLPD